MSTATEYEVWRKSTCAWGDKAVSLLQARGLNYRDHVFASKEEEARFKAEQGVETTPQIFQGEERIGGYDALADHLGVEREEEASDSSYVPVIAVFSVALLLALASSLGFMGFMGFALAILATLKLMDMSAFVESFKAYDLVAARFPGYGWVYPFAELGVGLGFISGAWSLLTGVVALLVGVAGGASIVKAVYIDKRDLNCACVGGNSNVPLGFVSFTENAMMAVMGAVVLIRAL